MVNCEKISQIYELIKIEAGTMYNYVNPHPFIIKIEREIEPLLSFISSSSNLAWYIENDYLNIIGEKYTSIIKDIYPNIQHDEFLSLLLGIWKELLSHFAVENGYTI
jgi:hypothetical protein